MIGVDSRTVGAMRLFWMAWSFAVLLVLTAIGGTGWVFAASEHWPDLSRVVSRAVCLLAALAAFVGAFRLALLATSVLRFVLAQNLAALIVMELDDLRQAAQERAESLAGASSPQQGILADAWRASEQLRIPRFFGERREIRKLLGPATERTLEQLLVSLHSYNEAAADARAHSASGTPAQRLWSEIAVVQERLRRAAVDVAPFCLAN